MTFDLDTSAACPQPDLFAADPPRAEKHEIAVTPEIEEALLAGMPLQIGVSGGKDSQAVAIAVMRYLRANGYTNRVELFHADMGDSIEWVGTADKCQELADLFGIPLTIAGTGEDAMLRRWRRRWELSIERYKRLSIVTLIQPWSSPSLRFCTSELKTARAHRAARISFGGQRYITVTGIRRDESAQRSRSSVSSVRSGGVIEWRPIVDFTIDEVFATIRSAGLEPHVAYTQFSMQRVSCRFCVMSSLADLNNSARVPGHAAGLRALVSLEQESGYSFQGSRWLMDLAGHVMTPEQLAGVAITKAMANSRKQVEARIPKHLLYVEGWPHSVPTFEEATLLAEVRKEVCSLYGFEPTFTTAAEVQLRYEELLREKGEREARAARRGPRGVRAPAGVVTLEQMLAAETAAV